ncbi:hypothetical protein [Desulfovibrio ferrophilus]|uniref:Uncharacterized protein n=1 Tax=Desulfovibrio ferrophilus TaxID=241368 RepID=A0A2Z6AXB7_9BACT|nr:hypothetical protein [Desulfovibrio ferrophilus]BBD07860.1 uncharacterized protein DFE_1134 [Desulfovibrio ferrophilus]
MRNIQFFSCTISIYPNLLKPPISSKEVPPIELIEKEILDKRDFRITHRNKSIKVLFRDLEIDDKTLQGGKIAVHKSKFITDDDGKHLEEVQIDDYPNILFLWSQKRQIIYIQTNIKYKIGIDIGAFSKILENIFTKLLRGYYSVNVKIMPLKGRFWEIIKESEKIYNIEFNLISPNIAGRTDKEVRAYLTEQKERYNVTNISETLENKDGNLKINEEDEILNAKVRTTEQTGGIWKIKNNHGTQKSSDRYTKTSVEGASNFFAQSILDKIIFEEENEL